MADSEERKEFTLSALRVASLRARLFETEINSIGVALKSDLIDCYGAIEWMKEIGAIGLMKALPPGPEECEVEASTDS